MRAILILALLPLPALAQTDVENRLICTGGDLRLEVVHAPGFCTVNGREGLRNERSRGIVCRIASPQELVLRVDDDLAFRYNEVDDGRITRGTCTAG